MSLVENFKDRVPTEVLSNGAIRYQQFDANGNSLGYVYFKRADDPSEVGNIWNKVIYDGIKEAIETLDSNKLAIASKATQAQAEAGSDNTNYMTALRTTQAIKQLCDVKSYDLAHDGSRYYLNNYITSNSILIEIESYVNRYDLTETWTRWYYDGYLYGLSMGSTGITEISTSSYHRLADSRYNAYFKIIIDIKNKLFFIVKYHGSASNRYTSSNDFTIETGICTDDTFGYIYARASAERKRKFVKVKGIR